MATAYGRIASLRPASTDEEVLYLVPASTQVVGVLRICNQDTAQRTYSIAHCAATGAASGDEWLTFTKPIDAGDTHEISINLGAAEEIRVDVSVVDKISFHLSGMTIT